MVHHLKQGGGRFFFTTLFSQTAIKLSNWKNLSRNPLSNEVLRSQESLIKFTLSNHKKNAFSLLHYVNVLYCNWALTGNIKLALFDIQYVFLPSKFLKRSSGMCSLNTKTTFILYMRFHGCFIYNAVLYCTVFTLVLPTAIKPPSSAPYTVFTDSDS